MRSTLNGKMRRSSPKLHPLQGLEGKAKRRDVVPAAKLFGTDPFHAVLTKGLLKSQVLSASSELQVLPISITHACKHRFFPLLTDSVAEF